MRRSQPFKGKLVFGLAGLAGFAGFALLASVEAYAQLLPMINGEVLGTLPRSRFMLSVSRIQGGIGKQFSATAESAPVSSLFNRDLTWNQVLDADPARAEQVAGLLLSTGVETTGSAGSFRGAFDGYVDATVPVVGYGLTDEIGIIAVLPMIRFKAESRVAYRASPSANQLVTELEASGQNALAREFSTSLNQGFEKRLAQSGYAYSDSTDRSYLGDLRIEVPFVPKKNIFLVPALTVQATATIILPTADQAGPNELFQFEGGEKRLALGLRAQAAYALTRANRLQVIGSLGGLVPFNRHRALRIPANGTDELPTGIDPNTQISGGALLQGLVGAEWRPNRIVRTQMTVQHQERLARNYAGNLFSPGQYTLLSNKSDQALTSLQASVELNSIDPFLRGKFLLPASIVAGLALPIYGRNTLSEPLVLVQSSIFF